MIPAARYAAVAEVLDAVGAGERLEPTLRAWGRAHRFAGSKDRRAIADIAYDVARRWWSSAYLGDGETGRARVLGYLRALGQNPESVFIGQGHAMSVLSSMELRAPDGPVPLDLPPFLRESFEHTFGPRLPEIDAALKLRAPVDIRANRLRTTRNALLRDLAEAGYDAAPLADHPDAIRFAGAPRGLDALDLFRDGHFEMQDAGSQHLVEFAEPREGEQVLDYCAGAGGKTLALAAQTRAEVVAHDIAPRRMSGLPDRAARAGAKVHLMSRPDLPRHAFDLVFVDAPCSGSGAWRRDPQGKIALTAERFAEIRRAQRDALIGAADFVGPGGRLVYATCSLLEEENDAVATPDLLFSLGLISKRNLTLTDLPRSDGFYGNLITTIANRETA